MRNLGTILSNIVQFDTCFEQWDGECAGRRLGQTIFALLDPSVEQTLFDLEHNILL